MALIEHTLNGKVDKVAAAIKRIKFWDPLATGYMDDPYYVAYSGGKDSDVIRILCELAGVKFDLVHNHTTVDAPETVRYVRSIPGIQISYPDISMWRLIEKKLIPPTRLIRYCCKELKERGGQSRFVITGVRWAESNKRKNTRGSVEIPHKDFKKRIILNADNEESRQEIEQCSMQHKRVLNPIIDWLDEDVWEFLDHYGCESNPLYQCGYNRIGCIGCPMAGGKKQLIEFIQYPKYKQNYIAAFDRMIQKRKEYELETQWETGEEVFMWWVSVKRDQNFAEQMTMWDEAVANQ